MKNFFDDDMMRMGDPFGNIDSMFGDFGNCKKIYFLLNFPFSSQ